MGYCFERDAPVRKDLRRIALAQVDSALARIDDHGLASNVVIHDVRKTCKKLRALLRLVRPCFAGYRAENDAFRDIAAMLSPLRDAAVLIETYDALMESCDGEIDRATFASVRRRLITRQMKLDRDADGADRKLGDVRDLLLAARLRVAQWKLTAGDFEALEDGLARTYRSARKAMKSAARAKDAEALHDWRKHVKYHSYQTRLMEPVWPTAMQAHRRASDQLNKLLGDHHDLAVLDDLLRRAPAEFGQSVDLAAFASLIDHRQVKLADQSFALGARLLAEPSGQLTQRWRTYWTQWRGTPLSADAA